MGVKKRPRRGRSLNININRTGFRISGELTGSFGKLEINNENVMQIMDFLKNYPLNRLKPHRCK